MLKRILILVALVPGCMAPDEAHHLSVPEIDACAIACAKRPKCSGGLTRPCYPERLKCVARCRRGE